MDKMNEIDNLKYDRIWLTDELGEVNWCQHKITNNDVEYANRNAVIDECIQIIIDDDEEYSIEDVRRARNRMKKSIQDKLERLKDKEGL